MNVAGLTINEYNNSGIKCDCSLIKEYVTRIVTRVTKDTMFSKSATASDGIVAVPTAKLGKYLTVISSPGKPVAIGIYDRNTNTYEKDADAALFGNAEFQRETVAKMITRWANYMDAVAKGRKPLQYPAIKEAYERSLMEARYKQHIDKEDMYR